MDDAVRFAAMMTAAEYECAWWGAYSAARRTMKLGREASETFAYEAVRDDESEIVGAA